MMRSRAWIWAVACTAVAGLLTGAALWMRPTVDPPVYTSLKTSAQSTLAADSSRITAFRHAPLLDSIDQRTRDWIAASLAGSGLPEDSIAIVFSDSTRFTLHGDTVRIDLSHLGLWWLAALAERPRGFGRIRYKLELSGNLLRLVHPGTILHEWLEEVSPGWQVRQAPRLRMSPESARAWLDPSTNGNWRTSDISMRGGEVVGLRVACSDSAPHFAPLGRFENLRTLELVGCRLPLAEQWMLAELPIHTLRLRDPRTNGILLLPRRGPLRVVEIHGGDLQKVFLKDGLDIHSWDNPPDSPPPAWSLRIAGARICDSVYLARLDSLGAVITASRCGDYPRQALAADARLTALFHHGPDSVYQSLYWKAACDTSPHVHVGPGFLADSLVSLFRPTLPLDRGYSIPSQVRSAGCDIYDPLGQDVMVDSINVGPWWVEPGMMSLALFDSFPSFGRLHPKSSRLEAAAFLGPPLLETDSWMVWQSEVTDSMAYVFCEERNDLFLHFDEAGGLDGILVSTEGCGDC